MLKKLLFAVALMFTALLTTACLGEQEQDSEKIRVAIYDTAIMDIVDAAGFENFNISALGTPHRLLKGNIEKYTSTTIDLGLHSAINLENLIILNPEVIILSSRFEQHREAIKATIPTATIYTGDYEYNEFYEGVVRNIEMLKTVFPEAATNIDEVFAPVNEAIIALQNDTKLYTKNVLVLLANGSSIATHGLGGRFDMIFSTFGFTDALTTANTEDLNNCSDFSHGCTIGVEFISKVDVDVILIIDRAASVDGAVSASVTTLKESTYFKNSKAYKNNDVYNLSSDAFYVNPGGINSTLVMIDNLRALLK